MLAKKILENLENGNYRIERSEHCDCWFDWSIENGELVCDTDVYDCWIETVWFIMDDLAGQRDNTLWVNSAGIIASYDACCGLTMLLRKASVDAERDIVKAIKNNYAYERLTDGIYSPDANNDLHDQRKREALVKWLSDNKHLRTYVYYPRDFANEYVCGLLVLPSYYRKKKDLLWAPVHWYSKSAEEWADMFLQKDMGGTSYNIGFELVNELYEIDYGWYDHRADMAVSHDAVRYYFVDLQGAENFLSTREPGGINCYELNNLLVDYDGMVTEIDYIAIKYGPEVIR